MHIFVRTLTGKTFLVEINSNDIVQVIKHKIFDLEGIPLDGQRLIFAGRGLEDGRNVSYYGIRSNSMVYLITRLRHNQ